MKNSGCWIFISHSSADIEKIRLIRNEFEKYGQNPLAFHLKCLSSDTDEGRCEIDTLIKREISARDWFVYCESANAANSQYVKMERAYVESLHESKQIWHIDLNCNIENILERVRTICTSLQVVLLYSNKDIELVKKIAMVLSKRDFQVWYDERLDIGDEFPTALESHITDIAIEGFVLAIVTKNCQLDSLDKEIRFVQAKGATLIVLIFDMADDSTNIKKRYKTFNVYDVPNIPHDEDMYLITNLVCAALERRIIGPIEYKAKVLNLVSELQSKLNYESRYHSQEAELISRLGAADDYCEVYRFPCCGKTITIGDAPYISKNRADGCCVKQST